MSPQEKTLEVVRKIKEKSRMTQMTSVRALLQLHYERIQARQEDVIFSEEWMKVVKGSLERSVDDDILAEVIAEVVFEDLSRMYWKITHQQVHVAGTEDDHSQTHWNDLRSAIAKLYPPLVAEKVLEKWIMP